jgi:hypothetical protein
MVQFSTLRPWIPAILEEIKKEIKGDYLPANPPFVRTHLNNRPLARIPFEEIVAAFEKELIGGNEALGEWVATQWVFKQGELYEFFAARLSQIHPDFSEIKQLSTEQSRQLLAGVEEKFSPPAVYLFSLLNQVVFPPEIFETLREKAEGYATSKAVEKQEAEQASSREALIEKYEREIARLTEKYEKKLAGVQRKYEIDTQALKKQVRALQLKLQGASPCC